MLVPLILSRVKQLGLPSCLRIAGENLFAFELIAKRATQAQIGKFCLAVFRTRNDMVKVETCHRHFLQGLAVLATILSGSDDLMAEFTGQSGHGV